MKRTKYRYFHCIAILLFCFLAYQCSNRDQEKGQTNSSEVAQGRTTQNLSIHTALPTSVKAPKDNPSSPAKVELGRLLFYDPILSGNKDVACATCHHPDNGYAEYRDLSIGTNGRGFGIKRVFNEPNEIPFVKRNAHTILNTAFNGINTLNRYSPEEAPMFWDMRVSSLEGQALEPILAFEEMRGPNFTEDEILDSIVLRLKAIPEYVQLFADVYRDFEPINAENIAKSIAAFERTLVTTNTRFDRYRKGDDSAISISEMEGFRLFNMVGCGNCHNGPMFSDFKPHVIGVPTNPKLSEFDQGINEEFAFRTPSLRNLRFTAPYMHNGKFNTLKEVLEFYEDIASGKNRHQAVAAHQIDPLIKELNLSVREIGPIISFLNSLNDTHFDQEIPEEVPSGLPVGGNIK